MVYELLLNSDTWIGLKDQVNFTTKRRLDGYGLLSTNRQIHQECLQFVYRHEILVVSACKNFEITEIKLSMPKSLVQHDRILTLHISAPELRMEHRMNKLRRKLLKAHSLEKLTIEIFPHKASQADRSTLVGYTGQYILRKGLSVLQGIKVRGTVAIRLAGHHEYGPNWKMTRRHEAACAKIVTEAAEAMVDCEE